MMLILLPLLLLPLLVFLVKPSLFDAGRKHPPGPNIFQILANISQIIKNPHIVLTNFSKVYGPLMSYRMGSQLVVVASTPDAASEILKNQSRVLAGRYLPSFHYEIPEIENASIVASRECDAKWKFLRALGYSHFFSSKAIESATKIRKEKCMEMVEFLKNNENGKVVNLRKVVLTALVNIGSNILASKDMVEGGTDEILMDFMDSVVDTSSSYTLSDLFPFLKGLDVWGKWRAKTICQLSKFIWAGTVKERMTSKKDDGQDFLDILAKNSFTEDQMCLFLMEMLIGVTISTSMLIVWMMAELIKNQEILDKVRVEIADVAVEGSRNEINTSKLANCKYFQAFIKEALRVYVPGPFGVPHRATEACLVNDYVIPKDSIVMVNVWAIHRNPKYWKEATMFKPERFLDSGISFSGSDFEYIPFSAGSRICPGMKYSVSGLQLVVASLVHYFYWSLPDGQQPSDLDMNINFQSIMKKHKPLCLIPNFRA